MAASHKLEIAPTQGPVAATDILTPAELSERLKLPVSWIYKNVEKASNPLPVLRCGRYLRFDWNAVVAWMRS